MPFVKFTGLRFYLHLVGGAIYPLLTQLVGGVSNGKKAEGENGTYAEAYYEKTPR